MASASFCGTSSSTVTEPSSEMTTLGTTLVSLVSQSLVTNTLAKLAGTEKRERGSRVMKLQLMIEQSRSKNRALQISRSLTGLLSLQKRAGIVVPLDGDRNDAADFDRGSMVREIDISLDVYGVAGGSDANYLPLGCDAPKLEEKECCQREQHVLRYYENFDVVDCSPH
jgi:hypothetical protein